MTKELMESHKLTLIDGGVSDPWKDPYLPDQSNSKEFPVEGIILMTMLTVTFILLWWRMYSTRKPP